MNYTIMTATKGQTILGMDKNGNRFHVYAWNKEAHRTLLRHIVDTLEQAESLFKRLCDMNGFSAPVATNITLADFANID